jgi:PIN domain nuclease of toxin-antitoxin system
VILVSTISLFEIAVKQKIGKLPDFDLPISKLSELIVQDGFTLLDVGAAHIARYADVPLHAEHRDPFDRLLLATALNENTPLVSADQNFALYQSLIQIVWAG